MISKSHGSRFYSVYEIVEFLEINLECAFMNFVIDRVRKEVFFLINKFPLVEQEDLGNHLIF